MLEVKELKTKEDFEGLQIGDLLLCEFKKPFKDGRTFYSFPVCEINSENEIILNRKLNYYFSYELYLQGGGWLKSVSLVEQKADIRKVVRLTPQQADHHDFNFTDTYKEWIEAFIKDCNLDVNLIFIRANNCTSRCTSIDIEYTVLDDMLRLVGFLGYAYAMQDNGR
ncbi:hypothetical protein ACE193_15430 [Bernardetia sp. OM2101]|uniref:hypothetical protein n=1 Tax=Bernardetia sp. OM2101 TaxID=3344876 RepID=UPI0035CF4B7F